jgi:hypothetical protein
MMFSKQVIDMHGGIVVAESSPENTTFGFVINFKTPAPTLSSLKRRKKRLGDSAEPPTDEHYESLFGRYRRGEREGQEESVSEKIETPAEGTTATSS